LPGGVGASIKAIRKSEKATETVQRVMSCAELGATKKTGLLRGGREGTHHVTPAASKDPKRAMQRLALDPKDVPEVRVTMEVPSGTFGGPTKVDPKYGMPGGALREPQKEEFLFVSRR
jgi:hypothetical protein